MRRHLFSERVNPERDKSVSIKDLKAVIFDLDNTLVDSRIDYVKLKKCVIEELIKRGVDSIILDEMENVVWNLRKGKEYLGSKNPSFEPQSLDEDINSILTEVEMERIEQVRSIPGSAEAIDAIKSGGLKVAVLTRASRAYTRKVLDMTGLNGRVSVLLCRDDYPLEEAKPNPMAMQRIVYRLQVLAQECILVGDNPMDFECADSSGTKFIGVLTGSTNRAKWGAIGCHNVISSVAELPSWLTSCSPKQGYG